MLFLAVLLHLIASIGKACALQADNLTIHTNVGTFRGSKDNDKVRNWLGIPFGASTNGTLRFRPPQRADILPKNAVFNATQFGLGCPQNKNVAYRAYSSIVGFAGTGNFTEGNDCLNLNIWSPSLDRLTKDGTAVLIWIYGGSGQYGNSAIPYYNGSNFVRDQDNITFVTFNYRTNLFGSPAGVGAPIAAHQTNPGLYDQRLAVEWVYANIRAFGGDPERITLVGESAGAGAIGIWPYAYEYDPIVKGLILQSGTEDVFSSTGAYNNTLAEIAWDTVVDGTHCRNVSNLLEAERLHCMQQLPFEEIQNAVNNYTGAGAFGGKVDNVTLLSAPAYVARKSSGDFAKIPMLLGTNKDEGTLFGAPADVITLFGFECPAAAVAQSRHNHSVPAFVYQYEGAFPNINVLPELGVFHSSEIPMVFGTYNLSTSLDGRPAATTAQIRLSAYMQHAWATFARHPTTGLINELGWIPYTNGTVLNVLGRDNGTHSFGNARANATSCGVLFPELR